MPGTEGNELVRKFASGTATDVIDGIAELVGYQAALVQKGIEQNETRISQGQDMDPTVNKMINDTIKNATSLAKLRNPNLTRPMIAIQNNNGAPQIGQGRQAAMSIGQLGDREITATIDQMVATGKWNRSKITEDDVIAFLSSTHQPQLEEAIEGEIVDDPNDELPF